MLSKNTVAVMVKRDRTTAEQRMTSALQLEPVIKKLPPGFDVMRAEAHTEGYRLLERFAADWD